MLTASSDTEMPLMEVCTSQFELVTEGYGAMTEMSEPPPMLCSRS